LQPRKEEKAKKQWPILISRHRFFWFTTLAGSGPCGLLLPLSFLRTGFQALIVSPL